ncbi:hypothetical protein [Deinococcus sp.]|uniref:hypothetical protein n=1 Tax=Deinococcus sp. TaxID=47478 RepID=UPI003C79D334
MRRLALMLLTAVGFAPAALASPCPPTYTAYASAPWVGGNVPPRLDTPGKRMFRTMIRLGAQSGERFADRYRLAVWGCGTGCQQGALVDTRSGKVIPAPDANLGYGVRPGSRLLVVSPLQEGETLADRQGMAISAPITYYLLRGHRLVQVCAP